MADGTGFRPDFHELAPKGIRNRLMASRRFQAWAARFPFTRRMVRREGAALFDIMAGFCHSQILMALAELRIPEALLAGPVSIQDLAGRHGIPSDRFVILMHGGAALGLLKLKRGRVSLTRRGAAFATVPGLSAMVRHHRAFYRDLEDPVAFFSGTVETELAEVWPYVFGGDGGIDPATAAAYSDLMAESQALVAEDTLRMIDLSGAGMLLDIGGGTGAFLAAVGAKYPDLNLHLFDLPTVAPAAQRRFDASGLSNRSTVTTGSFRDDALPSGADHISLIRVLYDHADDTVGNLLAKVYAALEPGGTVVISEPMSGGRAPDRSTDTYFALYTLAMRTGRTRSADEIKAHLHAAGFEDASRAVTLRPYVTSVITASKPLTKQTV